MNSTQDDEWAAVLDACVLVPMPLCDTLLRLAEAPSLYRPLWSEEILKEIGDTLENKLKRTPSQRERRIRHMQEAFPEASVHLSADLIQAITGVPDPDDRHVVAAAIHGSANVIVTANARHFPADCLEAFDIVCQTPDDFLVQQFVSASQQVLARLDAQAANIGRDRAFVVERLRSMAPKFATLLVEG